MGQNKSKGSGSMEGTKGKLKISQVPPESPLGIMIRNWNDYPSRMRMNRAKMVYYCTELWNGKRIGAGDVCWPMYGTFDIWMCQALNVYVDSKKPFDLEESEYAYLWLEIGANLYPLKQKGGRKKPRTEEEVPMSPPPYLPQPPPPPENPSDTVTALRDPEAVRGSP